MPDTPAQIVLADGKTTALNHTFLTIHDQGGGYVGATDASILSRETLQYFAENLKSGAEKRTVTIKLPVVSDVNGVPMKQGECTITCNLIYSDTVPSALRKDARAMLISALQKAETISFMDNGQRFF